MSIILYNACHENNLATVKLILGGNSVDLNKKCSLFSTDYHDFDATIGQTVLTITGRKNYADIFSHILKNYPDIEIPVFKLCWPKKLKESLQIILEDH